ncbi:MAG TPA: heme-binding protein [Thermoanaerobaculia bacterium]|nr:heme-binding protein [Thermoanaerobaculia bacterium]
MRSGVTSILIFLVATACLAQGRTTGRRDRALATTPDPPSCALPLNAALPDVCTDGAIGLGTPEPFSAISKAEANEIVKAAATALAGDTATIAIVDRTGRPVALFRQANANPANDDVALGVARTAAFFSNSQAPLSSRTVRTIAQVHFPPGVVNAPVGALYGIEQSNRGCDLNLLWNTNQCVPRAKSIGQFAAFTGAPKPCPAADRSGCGPGLITGKVLPDDPPYPQEVGNRPVNAGGIPLYRILDVSAVKQGIARTGKLLGAIGVAGIAGDPQLAEFAAVTGAFGPLNAGVAPIIPLPNYPLPQPQNVFIDGIRLPFIGPDQKLRFNSDGLPIGLQQLPGSSPGLASGFTNGTFVYGPFNGGCAPNGYLAGPYSSAFPGGLTATQVDTIVQRAVAASKRTRAQVRLPLSSYSRMVISVADLDGTLLAHYRMPDALFDAVDVVPAKARNVVYFNSNDPNVRTDLPGIPTGYWVTTRTIGFGAQPLYPPGIDSNVFEVGNGPWYSTLFLPNIANTCSQGSQAPNNNQNGITFFGGATPLVVNGKLVGGLGVSGDGIEQDDYVTYLGAGSFLPPTDKWADQLKVNGARLPMFKFPRSPEGVTECGGKPCS